MKTVFKFSLVFIIFLLFCNQVYSQNAVTWTGASVNTQVSSNSITMTGGAKWTQGAYSTQSITANTNGYVEATAQIANKGFMVGLSIPPNSDQHFSSIDYAIFVRHDGAINIFENGSKVFSNGGNYSANDIFRIDRNNGTITYYHNSNLIYTSQTISNTALIMDVSFRDVNATVHNALIFVDSGACSTTVYADTDGDGFGDPNSSIVDCTSPAGYVEDNTDCDDTDGAINPNTVWYQDNDGDDFGNPAVSQTQCEQPLGYVLNNTDCDDTTNDPTNNCGGGATVWTESGNDIRYSDGKVFIGNEALDVSSDDYNLFVEKGIMTERLKVAIEGSGDWADYVFADDYQRVKIAELEAFIKANKHLPNVPSAQEVADKGIDVAKMDATLLQQIEEIWLHVIDLKKENEALKQQIKDISKK